MKLRLRNLISAISIIAVITGASCFSSCRDESFSTDPNHCLSFSVDTLSFDTVFSGISSSTRQIMVRNHNKKALRISRLGLAKGASSVFQINAAGRNAPDHQFHDIEISAKDSMYIFVAVKVNELGQDAPLFIEDYLIFETNGNTQKVVLETYGQDVETFRGTTIRSDTTLTAAKPYIIYDSLAIVQGKTLKLEAGCRLYFHNNADLFVYGNLKAEGTFEKPIVMRGDRFDKIDSHTRYEDVAGQWGGLYLVGKGKHTMKHVNIYSGSVGIFIKEGSTGAIPEELPSLKVLSCKLHNFLFYGLAAQNADVEVFNTEISNTGSHSVYLNGGKHKFIQTTIANYFNSGAGAVQSKSRDPKEPAVMIMNLNKTAPMHTEFINSVIAGNVENEISLAARFPEEYQGAFKNTYIKRPKPLDYPAFDKETLRWWKKDDKLFKSAELNYKQNKVYNFEPDSVSPLRELADAAVVQQYAAYLAKDLNGRDRTLNPLPDAGAYEWFSDEE